MNSYLKYPLYEFDRKFTSQGFHVVGIDEAGRGPLAGPVVVAACVLKPEPVIPSLNDSKKLSPAVRESVFEKIMENSLYWSCKVIEVDLIDKMNILQATLHGMFLAASELTIGNPIYLVDGNRPVKGLEPQSQIIKGDSQSASIAAASVIAKVTRDRIMKNLAIEYPQYSFDTNFGYPTKKHFQALETYGATPHHRKSFEPVKRALERETGYDLFR
jgi:ribonuclease HII